MKRTLTLLVVVALTATAAAHKPSDAQLHLAADGDRVTGRIDVSVRDLDAALAIDHGDGELTWGELTEAEPRITAYLSSRLSIASPGSAGARSEANAERRSIEGCWISFGAPALVELSDGAYWSVPLEATCESERVSRGTLSLRYALLFDIDAQHRGLVHVRDQTLVVRDAEAVIIDLGADTSALTFVREGVWHIWIGLDHILFLLCLLLPAVYPRRTQMSFRSVAIEVLEIVSAFTLAHSITLVISAVGLFTLPSAFVETAIALSVVAAGVNNLVRLVDARWAVAFALGLLHGFGFSSVLIDLGLPSRALVGALLGFNLGVELGQAAIVFAVLPLLFVMRKTLAYRVLLFGGSAAAAAIAAMWTYQRCGL